MILDPNRDGIEVFYGDKIRNLTGLPENCVDWIINITSEKFEWESSKELYNRSDLFRYKGKDWIQYTVPYLDVNGIGRLYVDLFGKIGFKFDKVNVDRVKLD